MSRTIREALQSIFEITQGEIAREALAQPAEPAAPNQVFGIIDPDYARIFTQARIVAWQYGYACVAHGSFTRDLDLLLVPWADQHVPEAGGVVNRIADVCGLDVKGPPTDKPHGRKAWSMLLPGFNEVRWVDVSAFSPSSPPAPQPERVPLTGEQTKSVLLDAGVRVFQPGLWDELIFAARAIERAHGIKNEGE